MSSLVRGEIVHARRDVHARRTFRYPVYIAAFDLDRLPRLRLLAHNRRNLFALHDTDYEDGARGLREAHAALLAAHGLARPARVELVTNPRVLGYVFNPVSFFLGYDGGAVTSVVAEVNNTYGGRHRYVFGPGERIPHAHRIGFRAPRTLFVSPFLHGDATYELWVDSRPDALAITMHVDVDVDLDVDVAGAAPAARSDRVFVARLAGRREPLTDAALARAAVRYPFMTAQVIGLIYYEALKLHVRGVPYRRPGADHRPIRAPASVVSRASMK